MTLRDLSTRMRVLLVRLSMATVITATIVEAQAQPKPQAAGSPADSAQQFYFRYRGSLNAARSLADLRPWMTQAGYADAMKTPKAQQPAVFRALRAMNLAMQDIVVLERVAARDTVVFRLRGLDRRDGAAMAGAAVVVRESGAWKLRREEWRDIRK